MHHNKNYHVYKIGYDKKITYNKEIRQYFTWQYGFFDDLIKWFNDESVETLNFRRFARMNPKLFPNYEPLPDDDYCFSSGMDLGFKQLEDKFGIIYGLQWDKTYIAVPNIHTEVINFIESEESKYITRIKLMPVFRPEEQTKHCNDI
jgi:hypothetical protein